MSTECERVFSSAKKLFISERNHLTEHIIDACERLKVWWKKELIQQQKDYGGSELCDSEVNSFNSRGSNKVIDNGNDNASTAWAKFVHNGVRITHLTATPGSAAPFPNPEIYTASNPRGPSPPSSMRVKVGGRLASPQ
jgi:hypothetical protein